MKKQLLVGVSLVALAVTGPAHAAPRAPAAPPVMPVYSWTGWYAGGNVGYSWGNGDGNYVDPGFGFAFPHGATSFPGSERVNGAIGGGQAGYNWQVNNRWVVGFETDFQGSGEKGNRNYSSNCEGSVICFQSQEAKILWFGTVRGRAGVLVNPTMLLYGTAGLAYGRISGSGMVSIPGFSKSFSYDNSSTNTGWTAGGGVEGSIPGFTHWTWKVEYLYLNLGSVSGSGFDDAFDTTYHWSQKLTDNILRAGFNFHSP